MNRNTWGAIGMISVFSAVLADNDAVSVTLFSVAAVIAGMLHLHGGKDLK